MANKSLRTRQKMVFRVTPTRGALPPSGPLPAAQRRSADRSSTEAPLPAHSRKKKPPAGSDR